MADRRFSRYHDAILAQLDAIAGSQAAPLEAAAQTVFSVMRDDGLLHIFGSGHSHALAEEAFHRAGGLVPVNVIQEGFLTPLTRPDLSGWLERVSGLAALILDGHDLRPGEVLLVISNSGINAVPLEMALEGKRREAIRKQAGLDRFALQAKLMPYEHLLPPRFHGRNERIDERFEGPAAKRAAS